MGAVRRVGEEDEKKEEDDDDEVEEQQQQQEDRWMDGLTDRWIWMDLSRDLGWIWMDLSMDMDMD